MLVTNGVSRMDETQMLRMWLLAGEIRDRIEEMGTIIGTDKVADIGRALEAIEDDLPRTIPPSFLDLYRANMDP